MERQSDTPHPGLFFPVDGCSDKPNLGLSSVAVCCEETHLERSGDSGYTWATCPWHVIIVASRSESLCHFPCWVYASLGDG